MRNPCVYRKTGGLEKSLFLQKKKVDDRILAGVEIPAPGKKPTFEETSGTGKAGGPLTV